LADLTRQHKNRGGPEKAIQGREAQCKLDRVHIGDGRSGRPPETAPLGARLIDGDVWRPGAQYRQQWPEWLEGDTSDVQHSVTSTVSNPTSVVSQRVDGPDTVLGPGGTRTEIVGDRRAR
jgi:hypothetical protein